MAFLAVDSVLLEQIMTRAELNVGQGRLSVSIDGRISLPERALAFSPSSPARSGPTTRSRRGWLSARSVHARATTTSQPLLPVPVLQDEARLTLGGRVCSRLCCDTCL